MSTPPQPRQSAGTPAGGRYAATNRDEGDATLDDTPVAREFTKVRLWQRDGDFEVIETYPWGLVVRGEDGRTKVVGHFEITTREFNPGAEPLADPTMYRGRRLLNGIGPNMHPRPVDPRSLTMLGDAGTVHHRGTEYTFTLVDYEPGDSRWVGYEARRRWLVSTDEGEPLAHIETPGWMGWEGSSQWHVTTAPLPDQRSGSSSIAFKSRFDCLDRIHHHHERNPDHIDWFTVSVGNGVELAY